ncbi:YaiI/YqxD family protein [Clostridium sp.]|uniref:YaiI/YqxD family protein n=1 Tax=Clostridium sp. TaxID=1506 RepID=UPI002FC77B9C
MKVLIDGDGCPVVNETIKVAKENNIEVVILCDTAHVFNREGVETIIIGQGADSVDFALVNRTTKGDIVVTQDYGLASMILSKGAYPINQNGMVYTSENIDGLLFTRHVSREIRRAGGRTKGPKKRNKEDNTKFEACLRKLLFDINK